jgi:hypothetical protein
LIANFRTLLQTFLTFCPVLAVVFILGGDFFPSLAGLACLNDRLSTLLEPSAKEPFLGTTKLAAPSVVTVKAALGICDLAN